MLRTLPILLEGKLALHVAIRLATAAILAALALILHHDFACDDAPKQVRVAPAFGEIMQT